MKKIGLFGITGNPPHLGHRRAVIEALEFCEEVWVSLVYIHPFNKSFVDYSQRMEMLNMIFSGLKNIKIVELDKEYYRKYQKIPYSYDLLKYMKEYENEEIFPKLIIGEDNFKEEVWKKFYFYDKIETEFGLIVVKDSGVHSTQIRSFCLENNWERVKQECGEAVADYLSKKLIY